jgi:hypothetical protein
MMDMHSTAEVRPTLVAARMRAQRYRGRAGETLRLSDGAPSSAFRNGFLAIAHYYLELAEEEESFAV